MSSINNDAGDDRHDDSDNAGLQKYREYQAATRRAEVDGDAVDPRDVEYEAVLTEYDVGIGVRGILGRVPREAPGIWTLNEGAVDVEHDPLPSLDLTEDDLDVPMLTEQEQWWLYAALWCGMGGERGMVVFYDLPAMLDAGLRTLFSEREDDLAVAGLTMDDLQTLRRRLVRILTREATLVTEHDPLLAWVTRGADERTPVGTIRPVARFQRILIAELVNLALDYPPRDLRGEHVMRVLTRHADEAHTARGPDPESFRRDTPLRRIMNLDTDAQCDNDPRWAEAMREALVMINREATLEKDREELRLALGAAWTNETFFGTDRLDVTLPQRLSFEPQRVAVAIERVTKEVLPHIKLRCHTSIPDPPAGALAAPAAFVCQRSNR